METELSFSGTTLIPVAQNLVDLIWKERPPRPLNEVVHHPIEFSGKLTIDKLDDIRKEMTDSGSDLLVITELDEVACTYTESESLLSISGSTLSKLRVLWFASFYRALKLERLRHPL